MKQRLVLLMLGLILFSSCILKSIQPFYIKDVIKYDNRLNGNWTDDKKGEWKIISFRDKWKKETDSDTKKLKEDKEIFERYKKGYYITYKKNKTEASFIAMPFSVDNNLFIDVTPFEYERSELNDLVAQHLLKTHSAAYVKFEDASITLKWLSEKAVNNLIKDKKLRIKHEKTGIDEDLILTASSTELHQFLKKFMQSKIKDKWDSDVVYKLKPDNAKP